VLEGPLFVLTACRKVTSKRDPSLAALSQDDGAMGDTAAPNATLPQYACTIFFEHLVRNSELHSMVNVTAGPERWLLSKTRRTPVQTPVRACVRASPLESASMHRTERDGSGRFIRTRQVLANAATPKDTAEACGTASIVATPKDGAASPASGIAPTRIAAPRATRKCSSIKSVNLGYFPFPKQQQFHESPAKYRLFGGAAGPGKSKALLMEAILQAHETPGAQTLLLRRTFPELEHSLLYYFRRDVPRELYKSFNESKHVVEWQNGSTTRFGHCQNESDVYQYQGAEFLFIGIDELTLFTLRQWQFLTSRNRCPVAGSFPCMAAATNPGNIGHAWVKALWIDRQAASGMENPDAYDPADYDFIPARVSDNPIYAGDENYLKTLRALPSHLRRAFLDGDWGVFAGQYFDKFDYSRHVARAEQIDWKPWWPRWISVDWGFEHPSAAYWHAAIPPSGNVAQVFRPEASAFIGTEKNLASKEASYMNDPRRIVTYREYVTHRTPPRELARQIIERSLPSDSDATDTVTTTPPYGRHSERSEEPLFVSPGFLTSNSKRDPSGESGPQDDGAVNGHVAANGTASPSMFAGHSSAMPLPRQSADREHIDAIYLSPDAFARRTDEASIADQMGDVFVAAGFPRPVPADNDRVGGWMLMYQMLESREWLLTDNCIELIRTLPNLVRDPARIEDVEKMDGDDPADAARYGLKSRYGAHHGGSGARMPLAARLAERVTSADPTVRAIQARKAQLEESRRSQPVSFAHRRR
jgi:hypothetical protein